MRLPTQKKILREDLKDAPGWVSGIIDPINSFMENVYQSLNKNITLQDNVASNIKEITYRTDSSYPSPQEVVTFQNTLRASPIGIVLLQVYDKANYTPPPGPVYIPWVNDNGTITISTITGLEADKAYLVRMVVF